MPEPDPTTVFGLRRAIDALDVLAEFLWLLIFAIFAFLVFTPWHRSPWCVRDVDPRLEAREVEIFIDLDENVALTCPVCGVACGRYDSRSRTWRHLDTMQCKTLLTADVPRVKVFGAWGQAAEGTVGGGGLKVHAHVRGTRHRMAQRNEPFGGGQEGPVEENAELSSKGSKLLKGTRYLWLQNPENMKAASGSRFELLRKPSLRVARAW